MFKYGAGSRDNVQNYT